METKQTEVIFQPTKICSRCKIEKPTTKFGKFSRAKDGLQNWCQTCMNEYLKMRYASIPEFRNKLIIWSKAYHKKRYASDPEYRERRKAIQKKTYSNNPTYRRMQLGRIRKTICFKGKLVYLKVNPRTGVCVVCKRTTASGEIKRTAMHHKRYDPKHPERHTVELCHAGHRKVHTLATKFKISVAKATEIFVQIGSCIR